MNATTTARDTPLVFALLWSAFLWCPVMYAQGAFHRIALTGQQVPGLPLGVVYDGVVNVPAMYQSNDGELLFRASVAGAGVTIDNNVAMFHGRPGDVTVLWREGDQAPGLLTESIGSSFSASMTLHGQIAMSSSLRGTGVTDANDRALWVGTPSAMQLVAREGDPAVGSLAGLNFAEPFTVFSYNPNPQSNDSEHFLFSTALSGPGVTTMNDTALWMATANGVELLARTGDQATGAPAGVYFESFLRSYSSRDETGEYFLQATLAGANTTDANNHAIFRFDPEGASLVVREGDVIDGTVVGNLSVPALGPNGLIAFDSHLEKADPERDERTLFMGRTGDLHAVVYDSYRARTLQPSFGPDEAIYFSGEPDPSNYGGVWKFASGELQPIAGNLASPAPWPGATNGATWLDFPSSILAIQIGSAGDVTFAARVLPEYPDRLDSQRGLFIYVDGEIIHAVGDSTVLDGREIWQIHMVNWSSVNRRVLFNARFDNTTGGIYLYSPDLPGDFNGDGTVDAADYVVWRNGLGSDYTIDDYTLWKQHYGMTIPGGASIAEGGMAIPEPATYLGLALLVPLAVYLLRSSPRLMWLFVAAFTFSSGHTCVFAAQFIPIAITGEQADLLPAGIVHNNRSQGFSAFISDSGTLAFRSFLAGPGVTADNDFMLYVGTPGSWSIALREGSPSPGTSPDILQGPLAIRGLNHAGDLALNGSIRGPGVGAENDSAIWLGTSESIAMRAREGDSAPSLGDGVNFGSVTSVGSYSSVTGLNNVGEAILLTNLAGPNVQPDDDWALWIADAGGLELVAREGDPAPGVAGGLTFGQIDISPAAGNYRAALNDSGELALLAPLAGPGVGLINNLALWRRSAVGQFELAVRDNDLAPGTTNGERINLRITSPTFGPQGEMAFLGELHGPTVSDGIDDAIWVGTPGNFRLVTRALDPMPGGGGRFYTMGHPLLGQDGAVIFSARSLDNFNSGIFRDAGQGLEALIRSDELAPGTSSPLGLVRNILLNDMGQMAFSATLASDGDTGIWLSTSGEIELLIRSGDPLLGRTVEDVYLSGNRRGEDGGSSSFNDAGQLVFTARFTDGEYGIILYTPSLPGDFNFDGTVDAADYVVWRNGLGSDYTIDDYTLWKQHYGMTIPGGASIAEGGLAIPEPATHFSLVVLVPLAVYLLRAYPRLACLFVAAVTFSSDHNHVFAAQFHPIALTGEQADLLPSGIVHNSRILGFSAFISESGTLAFRSFLAGPGVTNDNDFVLYAGMPGNWSLALREGSPSPGTSPEILQGQISLRGLNRVGDLALVGSVRGPGIGAENDSAVWLGTSESIAIRAREGDLAPSLGDGVKFGSVATVGTYTSITGLNNRGEAILLTNLTGPNVQPDNDWALWIASANGLELVAREGDFAPGIGEGVTFAQIDGSALNYWAAINDSGELALVAPLTGPGVGLINNLGLWRRSADGQFELVLRENDLAPGTNNGERVSLNRSPTLGSQGELAFLGELQGPTISNGLYDAIWVGTPGNLRLVARAGAPIPGEGGRFHRLADPLIDSAGAVIFSATSLDNAGSGIFRDAGQGLAAIIRSDELAPGTDSPLGLVRNILLNATGQMAFSATLASDGDTGIWLSASGETELLIRSGDSLLGRTVEDVYLSGNRRGEDGGSSSFNDVGQIVFTARFTDGEYGIILYTPSLPGDFNTDGTVDAADYVVWRNGLGGDYTTDDYTLWKQHYGATPPEGVAIPEGNQGVVVPEPSALALSLTTLLLISAVKRRLLFAI